MHSFFSRLMLAAVAAAGLITGVTAHAEAASSITIHHPNGVSVDSGGALTIEGYNGSGWTESLTVECERFWTSVTVEPGQFAVSAGTITGPDACTIYDSYYEAVASFTVNSPTTRVSDAVVSSATFFPIVRDRYQDSVVFRWRQDHDGRAFITIVDAEGRAVRSVAPSAWRGRNAWTWNGKRDNGSQARAGRYRIEVTVNSNTVAAAVSVRTKMVVKTFTKRKEGNQAASFSTRGNCYARRDSYDQVASLDCWGGALARANYRIVIPADAFDLRATVALRRTDADICCRGSIRTGWARAGTTAVTFWATVNQWRATEVNFVRATYERKVRI